MLRKRRILVVDDDDDARIVLGAMLRKFGAEVINASSAATALAALQEFSCVAAGSDIAMPEADGYTLLGRIHAARKIPVIAVSAIASRQLALAVALAMRRSA